MGFKYTTSLFKKYNIKCKRTTIDKTNIKKIIIDTQGLLYLLYYRSKKSNSTIVELFVEYIAYINHLDLTFTYPARHNKCKEEETKRRKILKDKQKKKLEDLHVDLVKTKNILCKLNEKSKIITNETEVKSNKKKIILFKNLQYKIEKLYQKQNNITITDDFEIKQKELYDFIEDNYKILYCNEDKEDEIYASYLTKFNYYDAILSIDFDVFVLNPGIVIRKLFNSVIEYYDTNELFIKMDLTENEFLDFYLLCGCDFCSLYKIGIINGYKIIKEYGNIENYLKSNNIEFNFIGPKLQFNFTKYDLPIKIEIENYIKKKFFWIKEYKKRFKTSNNYLLKTYWQNITIILKFTNFQ